MIRLIIRYLFRLRNRDTISKAPRGLAEHFQTITIDESRVLERVGARSPKGVRLRLKKAGGASVDELVSELEYTPPRPPVRARLRLLIRRALGVTKHPHQEQIIQAFKPRRATRSSQQLQKVIKRFSTK